MPNAGARALRTRSTALVGLLVRELTQPPWGQVVSHLQEAAAARGLDCLMACSHSRLEEEERQLARMVGRRPEGLFLQPVSTTAEVRGIYQALIREHVRVVILDEKPVHLGGFPAVRVDETEALRLLTEHLVSLGHRRIGFIAGPTLLPEARRRAEAFRHALRRHGLEVSDRWVFSAGADVTGGAEAARAFLRERADCTALIADQDLAALGAARVLQEAGYRIPEDISLAGFGNQPCVAWFEPALTTVDLRPAALAAEAMRLMEEMTQGRPAGDAVIEPRLLVRASTGPPLKPAGSREPAT